MIDLSSQIRQAILNDPLSADISSFSGSKAIFTRRPAPTGATYPMVFIGPQIASSQSDYVNGKLRRTIIYDVLTYGQNDDAAKYRTVEKITFAIGLKFARPSPFVIAAPTGFSIVGISGTTPSPAPTDDLQIVGRMISVTIILQETA